MLTVNKKIIIILLFVLIIIALFFAVWNFSVKTKNNIFFQGYSAAIEDIMKEAGKDECLPFSLYFGDKSVAIVNVECLQPLNFQEEHE